MSTNTVPATERFWRFAFESRDQRLQRIYQESIRQTSIALRQLDRANKQIQVDIKNQKVKAKRECKQFGNDALKAAAHNIAFLRKEYNKGIWMKCRLEAALHDAQAVRNQVNLMDTMALLSRSMLILNRNSNFVGIMADFQRQNSLLQHNTQEMSAQLQLSDDDFYKEDESEEAAVIDTIIEEIRSELVGSLAAGTLPPPVLALELESAEDNAKRDSTEVEVLHVTEQPKAPLDPDTLALQQRLNALVE